MGVRRGGRSDENRSSSGERMFRCERLGRLGVQLRLMRGSGSHARRRGREERREAGCKRRIRRLILRMLPLPCCMRRPIASDDEVESGESGRGRRRIRRNDQQRVMRRVSRRGSRDTRPFLSPRAARLVPTRRQASRPCCDRRLNSAIFAASLSKGGGEGSVGGFGTWDGRRREGEWVGHSRLRRRTLVCSRARGGHESECDAIHARRHCSATPVFAADSRRRRGG